jgi:acetyl-CoA decarbonylase/synthase complex subunit delta
LKLSGIHPDGANKSAAEACDLVRKILSAVERPLVILGCGAAAKDNEVLPAVSEATKGERLLFGDAVQENYKTLTAACIADGHNIIAESPIDVNIAKQLNILISDLGLPLDRIVINPTIGALGYGLEYTYSIMERARGAALSGDKMLAAPFVCFVGQETWRTKETRVSESDMPAWGDARERGIMWEVVAAMAMLQAGADILTMRHPEAIRIVKEAIAELMKK